MTRTLPQLALALADFGALALTYRDLVAFLAGVAVMAFINWVLDHRRYRRIAREQARIRRELRG